MAQIFLYSFLTGTATVIGSLFVLYRARSDVSQTRILHRHHLKNLLDQSGLSSE